MVLYDTIFKGNNSFILILSNHRVTVLRIFEGGWGLWEFGEFGSWLDREVSRGGGEFRKQESWKTRVVLKESPGLED